MTDSTADSLPTIDTLDLAKFYAATALFFKRQPCLPRADSDCGIAGLAVSESSWAEWEAAVEAVAR